MNTPTKEDQSELRIGLLFCIIVAISRKNRRLDMDVWQPTVDFLAFPFCHDDTFSRAYMIQVSYMVHKVFLYPCKSVCYLLNRIPHFLFAALTIHHLKTKEN